jgi:hypothetical protein
MRRSLPATGPSDAIAGNRSQAVATNSRARSRDAGFVSGEAYKLGANFPYTRLPRTFLRQTINLGGESEKVEAGPNTFAGTQSANRVVLTVGKFAVTDVFDTNKYAHDARSDFLNWALIDTSNGSPSSKRLQAWEPLLRTCVSFPRLV